MRRMFYIFEKFSEKLSFLFLIFFLLHSRIHFRGKNEKEIREKIFFYLKVFILLIHKAHKEAIIKIYRLTSYVSTRAINPFGNAIANETIAASSPSLASAVLIRSTLDKFFRCSIAISSKSAVAPVALVDIYSYCFPSWKLYDLLFRKRKVSTHQNRDEGVLDW